MQNQAATDQDFNVVNLIGTEMIKVMENMKLILKTPMNWSGRQSIRTEQCILIDHQLD